MTSLLATAPMYLGLLVVVLIISIIHGATRSDRGEEIVWETIKSIFRVAVFLGGIGVALYVMTLF